ncbi:MAG: protein kinase [Gemmatimonadetes bacterium]|nr:protein kinase [Gemmatimonadota bacterium]
MSSGPPDRERVPPAEPGDRIHRYEIIELLGSGGMGVVYRARDVELGRDVALKCPWRDISSDQHFRARFLRESRASARLSHPNIVQILDAFERGDVPWIAMQLVEGETLDSYIAWKGKLPPRQVVGFAEQLALALEEAHKHRVLHRDIKPRNIMIEKEKRALLMDFGLARIMRDTEAGSQASTEETTLTGDGAIVGTPRYLSPEQARSEDIDGRSDIFSLGVVLYEMCTGVAAFGESQMANLIEAIMHREPAPISQFTYEVPAELERIIRKCLAKRPDQRYQSTRDLIVDLRNLRKELDYDEASSSRSHELTPPRSKRRTALWVLSYTALVACAIVLWSKFFRGDPPIPRAEPTQVTSGAAWNGEPVLSPEGTRIAYTSDLNGNLDIFLIDVHGGTPLALTAHTASDRDPAWFPDGSALVFTSNRSGAPAIWKVGQMGGGATLLLEEAREPSISPDGTRVAFSKLDSTGSSRIGVAPVDDPSAWRAITDDDDGLWNHSGPAWSPDGTRLCYGTQSGVWIVPAAGGVAKPLGDSHGGDRDPVWSASDFVYYSSFRSGVHALWRSETNGTGAVRVTLGSSRESHPTISADATKLAYSTAAPRNSMVLTDRSTGESVSLGGSQPEAFPALSPDGSMLVVASDRWGPKFDLWMQKLDGLRLDGDPVRLTDFPGHVSHPVFSPDGRYIAYYRILEGTRDVFVLPAEGGTPIRITEHPSDDYHPAWSANGDAIYYVSDRDGNSHVWMTPFADGLPAGDPVRITSGTQTCLSPVCSPDGARLAYVSASDTSQDVRVLRLDGSKPPVQVTFDAEAFKVRWDGMTGDLVVAGYWGEKSKTIRAVSPEPGGDGAPPEKLATFGGKNAIPLFDLSADGNLLVHLETDDRGDIWVMEAVEGKY